MLKNKNLLCVFLLFLVASLAYVNVAVAQSPTPTTSPSPTPTASPISNETVIPITTPTPTPNNQTDDNTTYVIVDGYAFQNINPNDVPLVFTTFTPAIVTLNYAQAISYSINSTTAPDFEHNEFQSPSFMTASIMGVGTYGFRFWVLYDQPVNQTITLMVYTQDQNASSLMTSLPLSIVNSGFFLDVLVTASLAPHPATAAEIANAQVDINRQLIENVTKDYEAQKTGGMLFNGFVAVVTVVLMVVVVILFKHVRRVDVQSQNWRNNGFCGRSE